MSAPKYDWLADVTTVQRKYLEDNYKAFYEDYKLYGYSVVAYDYARQIDEIYDKVKTNVIVESIQLPAGLEESIRKYYDLQLQHGNLKQIVVAVEDYHILAFTKDARVLSELRHAIKNVYCDAIDNISETVLHCGNVAIVFDDINEDITDEMLQTCELHSVPFIRRSTIGWNEPVIEKDAENILINFVKRSKPCKVIRD